MHMVEVMAVKRPAAGVVSVKRDGDCAHRRHKDGIAYGSYERRTVDGNYLEGMAIEMHRVRHHRVVHHLDGHALACRDHQRSDVRPEFAVE
jgi:hypothetical protein